MKATTNNPRWQRTPIRNEAAWIPRTLDDLDTLRRQLEDAGHRRPVINGLTAWLVAKALDEHDSVSGPTRARYRKILAELGPGPHDGDTPGRKLRDAGDIDHGTLVGAGLVGATSLALASGSLTAAAAAGLLAIAHNARPSGYVELDELEDAA